LGVREKEEFILEGRFEEDLREISNGCGFLRG